MGTDSYFVWVTNATTQLLTTHSDIFVSLGMNLFRGCALILIAWTGVQIALGSSSGAAVRFAKFAGLLLSIVLAIATGGWLGGAEHPGWI